MRRRLSVISLAATVLIAPLGARAAADDLSSILTSYNIVSWGAADGLPSGDIRAMAQDSEGYLWLGTLSGLVRFDGLQFTPWAALRSHPLPTRPVYALYVSRDRDLWVGFGRRGGIARLRHLSSRGAKEVRHYSEAEGVDPGAITTLVEDHRGTLWAGGSAGLFWFAADRWHRWTDRGLPDGPVHAAYVDSRDRLLVTTGAGVFVLGSERDAFVRVDGTQRRGPILRWGAASRDDWIGAVSVDTRDRVWLTDPTNGFKIVDALTTTAPLGESGRGRCLLRDRAGNVWVGTGGQGLWRVKQQPASDRLIVERASELTGLLGNGVMSLLEDREGNIWAATIEGLNRLRPRQATVLNGLGLVAGMEVEGESIWIATSQGALRFDAARVDTHRRLAPADGAITAMHADENGRLWLATGSRLATIIGGRKRELTLGDATAVESIYLVTSDRQGGVWLYDQAKGLLRWNGKTVQASALTPELVPRQVVWMDTQRDGTLWLLGTGGRVAAVSSDGRVHRYGTREGLDGDVYRAMYEDRHGIVWLAGNRGLTRFAQGTFQTLRAINGHSLVALTAVIEDESGSLWVGTNSGIVGFNPEDFDRAFASGDRVPYRLYTSDTLAGSRRWYGQRSAIRAADGRLWFVTSRGVTVIDPRLMPKKRDPSPVRIDGIAVDGEPIDSIDESRLPAATRMLEVSFGALALSTPERTHFRYRLDGFDTNWVEAGTRREAVYTNLPAGQYRFRVMASGADGTWPASGAVWTFSVAPMFYRTGWFVGTCISVLGLAIIAAWRLHLRQVRMRFSLLLGERVRLSREMHDTLLQGLFGVALRCDAIASELETSSPKARDHFAKMRRDVEEYIREARQSIWNLRSSKLDQLGLATALRETGEHATADQPVRFVFAVSGKPKPFPHEVEEHLLRLGQEAVANAVRHAHASEIRLELRYEDDGVALRLTDDGFGFDLDRASGDGHCGLINMKERAEAVGGEIQIDSRAGHGTRVEVRVPHGRAHAAAV